MKILKYNDSHNIAGQHIKQLRAAHNLSQDQVAARMQLAGIQINQKAISRIESGDRVVTDYELMRFAEIFSITPDELLQSSGTI